MKSSTRARLEAPAKVAEGSRNDTLFRLGRSLRARGFGEPEILATLIAVNGERCNPPLPRAEVQEIARQAAIAPDRPEFKPTHAGDETVGDWPEPEEIGDELVAVESLKEELIPPVLRPWILDRAEVFQCPPDYFATAAIVAAGSHIVRQGANSPQAHHHLVEHAKPGGGGLAPPGFVKRPAKPTSFLAFP